MADPRPMCEECGAKRATTYVCEVIISLSAPVKRDGNVDYDKAHEERGDEDNALFVCNTYQ